MFGFVSRSNRFVSCLCFAAGVAVGVGVPAHAQTTYHETGAWNEFYAQRQAVNVVDGAEAFRVAGSIDDLFTGPWLAWDILGFGDLQPGFIYETFWENIGAPGQDVYVFIDNVLDPLGPHPQTLLRDPNTGISDDFSSPVASAGAIQTQLDAQGGITLQVTGPSDFGFTGNHFQQGEFVLFINLNPPATGTPFSSGADSLDYFAVQGLVPNGYYAVGVQSTGGIDLEPMVGVLDGAGAFVATVENFEPQIFVQASSAGVIDLAVTDLGDPTFIGDHIRYGQYGVDFTPPACASDVALPLGEVGLADVSAYVGQSTPLVQDLAAPSSLRDFFDIAQFQNQLGSCP